MLKFFVKRYLYGVLARPWWLLLILLPPLVYLTLAAIYTDCFSHQLLIPIFIISLIAVLILLGVIEWADPSFKAERQVARYLDLTLLGSLPDLNKFSFDSDTKH